MMKFWQLVSVFRDQPDSLSLVLQAEEWMHFNEAYTDFDELVERQERDVLDEIVPDKLVLEALRYDRSELYVSDGYLRLRPFGKQYETTSVLSAYQRYGGEILEEVLEKGLAQIW